MPAFAQSGRCNKEMSQEGRKDFIPGINTAKVLYTRKTDTHQGAASSNHEDFEGEDMMREVASDGKKQGKLPTNKNRWHDTRLALSYSRPAGANQAEVRDVHDPALWSLFSFSPFASLRRECSSSA